jgi:hypothetical protein
MAGWRIRRRPPARFRPTRKCWRRSVNGQAFRPERRLIVITGLDPIVITGLDPIVITGLDPIVITGLDPIVITGLDPVISRGTHIVR